MLVIMGQELVNLFNKVRKEVGLYARFQMSVQLKIPSMKAMETPDDPDMINRATAIVNSLISKKK